MAAAFTDRGRVKRLVFPSDGQILAKGETHQMTRDHIFQRGHILGIGRGQRWTEIVEIRIGVSFFECGMQKTVTQCIGIGRAVSDGNC